MTETALHELEYTDTGDHVKVTCKQCPRWSIALEAGHSEEDKQLLAEMHSGARPAVRYRVLVSDVLIAQYEEWNLPAGLRLADPPDLYGVGLTTWLTDRESDNYGAHWIEFEDDYARGEFHGRKVELYFTLHYAEGEFPRWEISDRRVVGEVPSW